MRVRVSRADGVTTTPLSTDQIAPAVSADYLANIAKYDDQIVALQKLLKAATNSLAGAQLEVANALAARADCSFTATQYGLSAVIPGSGILFSADQNKCLDENSSRQDKARTMVLAYTQKVKQLNTQIATVNAQKDAANIDLRTQQSTEVKNETQRIQALATKAVAEGSVDPEVVKAKGEAEATANDANNKKILYAGVVIVIVLAAIGGLYIVATRKSA